MPKRGQIIQCQCGAIYVTKNLNFKRSFRCPECGQPPNLPRSEQNDQIPSEITQRSLKLNLKSNISAIFKQFPLSSLDHQGYFKFKNLKVLDAPLYIHWLVLTASTLILIIYWSSPVNIVLALVSYFSVIFIHEVGHAAMAKKVECRVSAIRIGLVHGVCEHEEPKYELDEIKIAWSGVVLQIMVATLVFSLSSFGLSNYNFFGPILVFMGYFSLLIVPYNLIPLSGLDGQKAWRIIPVLYQQLKNR
ncbi:MAG: hypothetical protein AAFO95_11735 [Cyanobacteria bacterium J06600_6]